MDGCRTTTTPPASQSSGWPAGCSKLGDEELGVFTADAERYFNDALAAEDAFWCDRSSSSFSSVFKAGQHEGSALTPTAVTSSSEASWNSRSALLPNQSVPVAVPAVEAKPKSRTASEQAGRKPQSSSHLRRWLLGVAGCACACGDGEEPLSANLSDDEVEAGSADYDKKPSTYADATPPRRTNKHNTAMEDVTTVRVTSGKWVNKSEPSLAGTATLPPLQLAKPGGARAAYSDESSMRVLNPVRTTKASFEEHRCGSLDMFHPAGPGSTLVPVKQNSAFTIVAGSMAHGGAASARSPEPPDRACGSRLDSGVDDAAPSELECMYPPSEASVVWSVVTAEGAASGNFSSVALGYYYNFNHGGEEDVWRHTSAGGKGNRRSRIHGSGMLMGCISRKAADTIGPPRT